MAALKEWTGATLLAKKKEAMAIKRSMIGLGVGQEDDEQDIVLLRRRNLTEMTSLADTFVLIIVDGDENDVLFVLLLLQFVVVDFHLDVVDRDSEGNIIVIVFYFTLLNYW